MARHLHGSYRRGSVCAMRNASDRQILVLTVLVSMASVVYVSVVEDWIAALITLPMFMTVSYFALRVSRRMGQRFGPKPPEPKVVEPVEQSSERPDHARRRRERKRRRGRGRAS